MHGETIVWYDFYMGTGYPDLLMIDVSHLFSPPEEGELPIEKLIGTFFECGDREYAVHPMRSYILIWKFDGVNRVERYIVNKDVRAKDGLTCDCRSGQQYRNCRHKEMARQTLKVRNLTW